MPRLAMVLLFIGCASVPDYGPPDDHTAIAVDTAGGFAGPNTDNHSGVHVVGTTATYIDGATTVHATLAIAAVTSMIHALEDVDFIDLPADARACAVDAPVLTIEATLAAGANRIDRDQACGGTIGALEARLAELSGFTAWRATRHQP